MNYNNLDEIYVDDIQHDTNGFTCPVCNKTYKREKTAVGHYAKKQCHSMVDMFQGTDTEMKIRSIATVLLSYVRETTSYSSMKRFRKSRIYSLVARLFVYNTTHGLHDIENYLLWGVHETKSRTPHVILAFLLRERLDFKEFFKFRRDTLTEEEQERFYLVNETQIHSDINWLLRQAEKGIITFDFLSARLDLRVFVDSLNDIQKERLTQLIKS